MAFDKRKELYSQALAFVVNSAVVKEFPFDIYVGTSVGFLKGCRLDKKSFNLNTVSASTAKQAEITCLEWCGAQSSLLLARRDGSLLCYQPQTSHASPLPLATQEQQTGIIKVRNNQKTTAVGFENGIIQCYNFETQIQSSSDPEQAKNESSSDLTQAELVTEIKVGSSLQCMDLSASGSVAAGGQENLLKVWDITVPEKPTFTAKNVSNDWLNLRVPIWETNVHFIANSSKIVTSTGYSQIRVYDPLTAQRRPVLEIQFEDKGKKYPITAMDMRPDSDVQCVIGTTVGTLALADLRNKGFSRHFKGSTGGGITDLKFHPSNPNFASCGMDSYLHCFDVNTSKKTHSLYLGSPLNCLIFSPDVSQRTNQSTDLNSIAKTRSSAALNDASVSLINESDELWENMEVVQTKKRKIKSFSSEVKQKRKEKFESKS